MSLKINKVYNGDSIKLIQEVPSSTVDLILSDIPYGISYDTWDVLHNNTNSALGGHSKAQNKNSAFKRRGKPLNGWSEADKQIPYEYQKWCSTWAESWLDSLKPGASCFIFAGRRYAHRCIAALEDSGFTFKDMLSWDKGNAIHRAQHVSSVLRRRHAIADAEKWENWRLANLRPEFEPILWFQKPYKVGTTITDNILKYGIGAWNEKALQKYNIGDYRSSANMIKVETLPDDHIYHEAQKPLNLMKLLIELTTQPGQLIVDPFMGSGTTCVAAKKLSRNYIGMELETKYYEIAQKRLKNTKVNDELFLF